MPGGRPRARMSFIPDNMILTLEEILREEIRYADLVIMNLDSCIEWLVKRRLLLNSLHCGNCNELCSVNSYSDSIDKYRWYCPNCKLRRSIRLHSFFFRSHLSLHQCICILYMWSYNYSCSVMKHELNISKQSVTDWMSFIREVCTNWCLKSDQIGGINEEDYSPKEVEIDESVFGKRKYHHGRRVATKWVFGAIERGSRRCFMEIVPDRTAATLLPLIEKWIAPGSRIISDGWQSYNSVSEICGGVYTHDICIHQENFVHPDDATIHTQNVESFWCSAKQKLKTMKGMKGGLLQSYLDEVVWRRFHKPRYFPNILSQINAMYPI
jgi:transposase-like protein